MQQQTAVDGRRARRERGRQAVVDAMLDLVMERGAPPPVEELAARAGVSVSSVFRYFDTLDDLQRETTARFLERHASLFEVPRVGDGPRSERIGRFVTARVAQHRAVAPIARLSRARALDQPHLAATLADTRRRQLDQVRTHFAPELDTLAAADAADVAATIATLTAFEAWDQLTADLGRTDAAVRRSWEAAIAALLP
ncbi:MAG: TetR/AcrR family transcriptional regulator [Ilumatobacteraceae bacterium]|nr:TetR/AcrR family transcriptional regulator [Ilumatobacteraceae bacterium]